MKIFRFKSISLLSHAEKKARRITFSPHRNLLVGGNHTGKSTIIKSLFITLGAYPEGKLSRWDVGAITLVSFTINEKDYSVLYQKPLRALFDDKGSLLFLTFKDGEWGTYFSQLLGFNLALTDKNNETVIADARAFFLPFYINQDGSWFSGWNTFRYMGQYKSPVPSVLDYFTGVKPPEYYELNSMRRTKLFSRADIVRDKLLVEQVRLRLSNKLPLSGPKVVPEAFEQDISRLTSEITELNAKQEDKRNELVRLRETVSSLFLQIQMADEALRNYKKDTRYLQSDHDLDLTCPTCGAEHNKIFFDLLSFTDDARVLFDLSVRLKEDLIEAQNKVRLKEVDLKILNENYVRINKILEIKRGDLILGDVILGMGGEAASLAFEEELSELKSKIKEINIEIDSIDADIAVLVSRKRSSEILSNFRISFEKSASLLNVSFENSKKMNLSSRPDVSGSAGPRSILAYYAAIWSNCSGKYGSFSVPLVIDSPQQQGQDEENLPRMIAFISSHLLGNKQIILGAEATTQETFDHVVRLSAEYRLLQEDEWDEVKDIIDPFLEKIHEYTIEN